MNSPLIELLVREMRVSEREVLQLIATAPERYKVYTIPKRRGGRREIAHPAKELKVAQRAIMNSILSNLPVHDAAYAYVKGRSIRDNAAVHAGSGSILKYDFKDFFPSITEFAWISYCERHNVMGKEDAIKSGRILFRRPSGGRILRLSIGAPSSPMLSNILLYEFDAAVSDAVSRHNIKYTRYADDLTFSAPRTGYLNEVDRIIRRITSKSRSPKLKINEDKTLLATKKVRRSVTGLVLTIDGGVSSGRIYKRNIRAAIDHFRRGILTRDNVQSLSGHISHIWNVERDYYYNLERVYTKDLLERIRREGRGASGA